MTEQNPNDAFSRQGGTMSPEQLRQYIQQIPMEPYEREYVMRVMERFDIAGYSVGITREEFLKGLDEMAKNPDDPLDPQEVERIKQYFK